MGTFANSENPVLFIKTKSIFREIKTIYFGNTLIYTMDHPDCVVYSLSHISLETFLWDMVKQCRPRSGSPLLAYGIFLLKFE